MTQYGTREPPPGFFNVHISLIRYRQWQEQREQAADEAAYKKNPDLFHNKMEIMEAARLRLQARYDEDAIRAEEKRQEAEDRKTEQEIKEWEDHLAGKGYKNR